VEDLISKHSVATASDLSQRLQLLQQKHILAATLKVCTERAMPHLRSPSMDGRCGAFSRSDLTFVA